jgi:hypothetical protein
MPEAYLVIGRVIPERKSFGHDSLRLNIKDPDIGIDACVIFRVDDGQLTARIICEFADHGNFTLKNIVRQVAQSWLNAHAFVHGETFEVDIVGILKDVRGGTDGSVEFHYQDNVHDIIRDRVNQADVQTVWSLCESEYLRRTLNDLRMALMYHDDGPFYCYRALDTIRLGIGRENNLTEPKDQWVRMWEVLDGSRDEIAFFEKLATAIRHGDPVAYSGEEWRQAILSTWNVVERYVLHLLHNR